LPPKSQHRVHWLWLVVPGLIVVIVIIAAAAIALSHAESILRARVLDTLSTRFKARVVLDGFHVSTAHGIQVHGENLKIYPESNSNPQQSATQPLITITEFQFQTSVLNLLRSPMRVSTVYVNGLELNLPPKERRATTIATQLRRTKIEMYVDQLICEDARIIINSSKPDKPPLEFELTSLTMKDIGPGQPLNFDTKLTNPKPIGLIASKGFFGPWNADSPRDTPVRGNYSFSHADLSSIKGIGGILSSTGQYSGSLDNIVVDGVTDTPDFRISTSGGHPVPLHTSFHAVVDGATGDTYLQPVNATLLHSSLVASGSVLRMKNVPGHHIQLDVTLDKGRIEDLLETAVQTSPPAMTGELQFKTKFDLPPGDAGVPNRLRLAGNFRASAAHFTNQEIQTKINQLSLRSQGKPELANEKVPENVPSNLDGVFTLNSGVLSFSQLHFQAPGAQVSLTGTYTLEGKQLDFHGTVRLQAKPSQMVTGWRSILLKPVDPFLEKNGAGTQVPVKISGTESQPHFGLDLHRKER